MDVKIFPFEKFHGKPPTGSGNIRVRNVIKHWPEAREYRYGDNPDVMIFQKVYVTSDFDIHRRFPGIKILDVCDPDWMSHHIYIKRTLDAVDAVTCPTESIKEFLSQMTDKPIKVIKDRYDVSSFPPVVKHERPTQSVVWYGYSHNAEILRDALVSMEKRNLPLTIISDKDPGLNSLMDKPELYNFVEYDDNIHQELQKHDVCILPYGNRPEDRFKSENKEIRARLLGIPVAKTAEELDNLMTSEEREREKEKWYAHIMEEYDVRNSIEEYKELIRALTQEQ